MCRVLAVSTSGYYRWRRKTVCRRAEMDAVLLEQIRLSHARSGGTYGSPRIHADLRALGYRIGRKRVARLMHENGLEGRYRRKRWVTTVRSPRARPAPDLVDRAFAADAPNQLWLADITHLLVNGGTVYMAVIMDAFSRRIVGWAVAVHMRTDLVIEALEMALKKRNPVSVIHHSDQGSQYTSMAYLRRLELAGIRPSMGSVGDCYDNAMCESFFATLKREFTPGTLRGLLQLRTRLFTFIEGFYNSRRRHSSINYNSPIHFEKNYYLTLETGGS